MQFLRSEAAGACTDVAIPATLEGKKKDLLHFDSYVETDQGKERHQYGLVFGLARGSRQVIKGRERKKSKPDPPSTTART